ncbi:MAG: YceH family protein [Piscinibacter sp.]|uniref:YceH family protein n=1 Tax=Piscinibacter sp. TaxID=1903157 RepID=UPI001B59C74D|nr:YceH family protein [Piscinibacter sp.]MBP5992104.1 YceH family protein [Piscinibacter sp.]MBP6029686.1 YceH family protein [Piscinibacter sp.]
MSLRPLSLLETRVLGVLVEKQHTVPDSYPLSLNALTLGCNQKTARDPVLNATEAEVQDAVDALRALSLVFESSGSRVARYEHNAGRVLALPSQSVALLAVLMLRGPQTASELRANCERLHRFADTSSVEAFLDELAARAAEKGGPLALRLPRAPGAREPRWTHLLAGAVDVSMLPAAAPDEIVASSEIAALKARQDVLQREVDELRALVERLHAELGIAKP